MTTRPVWLLSMDSENFDAAPTTTATLQAFYQRHSQQSESIKALTDFALVHFRQAEDIGPWQQQWLSTELPKAQQALAAGLQPVLGISLYTWNAANFLELVRFLHDSCPELLIIAGGPHVQQAEDYLGVDPIDVVVIGEGEQTFTDLLDCASRKHWPDIPGLAFLGQDGAIQRTSSRDRIKDLETIPSPLEILALTDEQNQPLYESICYETSRGCPFKCAFCEWGTGAIGTKLIQFPLDRVKRDFRSIVDAGIENIWLADSNFGAQKADVDKADYICELKDETGLPRSFATSWAKTHNKKVQHIVLNLNRHGLLPHYQLALQTLTPRALELCNRKNMGVNEYTPIAKDMARNDVPIAAELIWGLPGDNLPEFERNLDTLLGIFPNVNIFAYTLLPGTEFYEKRDEYQIQTIPIAGYGKALGEYVVGSLSYDREQGIEGYFLITAHIILIQGQLLSLTTRYLCLQGDVPASPLLRVVLQALLELLKPNLPDLNINDKMAVYEQRNSVYIAAVERFQDSYRVIHDVVQRWLEEHQASDELINAVHKCLQMDEMYCPRTGTEQQHQYQLDFAWQQAAFDLKGMELPAMETFIGQTTDQVQLRYPGGVGDMLIDPNGGAWVKGQVIAVNDQTVGCG